MNVEPLMPESYENIRLKGWIRSGTCVSWKGGWVKVWPYLFRMTYGGFLSHGANPNCHPS